MNKSFAIACLAATALAGPNNGHSSMEGLGRLGQDPQYGQYMATHNKNPRTTAEYTQRQENYHHNDNIISMNNRNADTSDPDALILGHNYFSDWSNEEYRNQLNLPAAALGQAVTLPAHDSSSNSGGRGGGLGGLGGRSRGRGLIADATTVDHFADGFMHSVKNQGSCGSCWAFAANTASEGTLAKKTNNPNPIHMSEQHMVDCTLSPSAGGEAYEGKDYHAWGCQGAWMEYAWEFQKDHGVMLEADYPYTSGSTGQETSCKHDDSKTVGKIASWNQLTQSVDDMKARVRQQPVTVALDAGGSAFQMYSSGVVKVEDNCGTQLNHAVVVVGYSDGNDDGSDDDVNPNPDPNPDPEPEPTPSNDCTVTKWWHTCPQQNSRRLQDSEGHTDYWKVQNSWSTGWGDQGFIKIQITDGTGVCGINSVVQYVDWADKY